MLGQLDGTGFNYKFIQAVDGRAIGAENLAEQYGLQIFRKIKISRQTMNPGAIGCLLSHLQVYEKMIAEGVEIGCVLEDDALLGHDFGGLIASAKLHHAPWDVLLLGHYSMYRQCFKRGAEALYWRQRVYKKYCVAAAAEFPFTAIAYLIKKEAARRLLKYAFPLRMPIDWILSNAELSGVRLRLITPPCVLPQMRFRKQSTIRQSENAAYWTLLKKYDSIIQDLNRRDTITRRLSLEEADRLQDGMDHSEASASTQSDAEKDDPYKPRSRLRKAISITLRKLGYAKNAYTIPV